MSLEELQRIAQEIHRCTLCGLHQGRVKAVPGEGPANAAIMFIGEGPGYHEDRMGRPFVGAAGQFLEELLALAGMKREDVFIGNVIKCRPPQNRDPQPDEVDICTRTYLYRQIEAINPSVIVTLGRFSMSLYMPNEKISRIHGQSRIINGRLIVPMMHPAAGLHQPKNRSLIEDDFRSLPGILAQQQQKVAEAETIAAPATATPPAPEPQAEQLSMF